MPNEDYEIKSMWEELAKWDRGLDGKGKNHYPICSCHIEKDVMRNAEENKNFLIKLFFTSWIDQVLYYLLMDSHNLEGLDGYEVYKEFKKKFDYPDVHAHLAIDGVLPPGSLIVNNSCGYNVNLISGNDMIFKLYQNLFWTPVAQWLKDIGRKDIVRAAINEFKKEIELGERIPNAFTFLDWENLD